MLRVAEGLSCVPLVPGYSAAGFTHALGTVSCFIYAGTLIQERPLLNFFIYLFIFRERGREGERERNINVSLPLARPPLPKRDLGQGPQLRVSREC